MRFLKRGEESFVRDKISCSQLVQKNPANSSRFTPISPGFDQKNSVLTGRVPFDYQLLSTREKDCFKFVMFKLVLLCNIIIRSDVNLTDWHMVYCGVLK